MRSTSDQSPELLPQSERALYLKGIDLFNVGEFFEAHEVWEDIWRPSRNVKREFFQGLIQCAVALEHLRRGNGRGARRLYDSYLRHFSGVPETYLGVHIPRFLHAMEAALRPVLAPNPEPERGELMLDPSRAILLVVDLVAIPREAAAMEGSGENL
jgi:hypothetical protein